MEHVGDIGKVLKKEFALNNTIKGVFFTDILYFIEEYYSDWRYIFNSLKMKSSVTDIKKSRNPDEKEKISYSQIKLDVTSSPCRKTEESCHTQFVRRKDLRAATIEMLLSTEAQTGGLVSDNKSLEFYIRSNLFGFVLRSYINENN